MAEAAEKSEDLEDKMQKNFSVTKKHYPNEMEETKVEYEQFGTHDNGDRTHDQSTSSYIEIGQDVDESSYKTGENVEVDKIPDSEQLKRLRLEQTSDNIQSKNKPALEWVPSSEDIQKNNEDNKESGRGSRRTSHYLQNIQIPSSNIVFNLSTITPKKDSTLLSEPTTVVRFSPIWKQTIASLPTILLLVVSGMTSGYSAILLPELERPGSPIPTNEDTASWIAAMAVLPMAPGCLVAGWMLEFFGRRKSLFMSCPPLLLGWVLVAIATNLPVMLVGRLLSGFIGGVLGPLSAIYIGETTTPKYRGFFLAGVALAVSLGILIVHVLGTFLTFRWTAAICAVFPIISFYLLTFTPESPIWLISKGRIDEGVKAYYWLRGCDEDAKLELKGIIDSKRTADSRAEMNFKEKMLNLKNPEFLKPLVIMMLFFITAQCSGVNAIAFYSVDIVVRSVGDGMDHYLVVILLDLLRFVVSLIACVTCRLYGRRPLCFISGIWTAFSMGGLAMYLYYKPENMTWIPVTCLLSYICAISVGLVPLPWIMCGEVFPTRLRGLGSGISSATTFVAAFAVVKTAPGMMTHLGEIFTFSFYGAVALAGTIVMFFILPETKGQSLQQIEDRFKTRESNNLKV